MGLGPVGKTLQAKLQAAFSPQSLNVIDDSVQHHGHGGAHPEGESHFTIEIVSDAFRGKSRVEQHRMVNGVLSEEAGKRVHALSIRSSVPEMTFADLAADDPRLLALLAACDLHTDDLGGDDKFFTGVLGPRNELLASGGLEIHGPIALLRSVAVSPDRRGGKLGTTMALKMLNAARNAGASHCYLLTVSAAPFFARLGFEPVDRGRAPAEIAATGQFKAAACAGAGLMRKTIAP